MSKAQLKVFVIGATGSVRRLVAAEAIRSGHKVCALIRSASKASRLPGGIEIAIGDVTKPDTLAAAVDGVDATVLTERLSPAATSSSMVV